MEINNRNAFVGCLGHIATHSLIFTILFRVAIQYGFPYPFYILIWMSMLMFFVGIILSVLKFIMQLRTKDLRRFFPIKSGPLFLIYFLHSLHWSFMMCSQLHPDSLPIVKLVIFSTFLDNIFTALFSRLLISRLITLGHFFSLGLGLLSIFFTNFLDLKKNGTSSLTFALNFTFTNERIYAYIYLIISRGAHSLACLIYKRALLSEAANQRFRAFKLSPFLQIKLFDFEPGTENVGELIKPTVAENSRIYKKAQYYIQMRKIIAEELVNREQELIGKDNQLDPTKIIKDNSWIIDQLDRVEKSKAMKHRGISERQREIVLEELRHENVLSKDNILEYYNKWSNLATNVPKNFDSEMQRMAEKRKRQESKKKKKEEKEAQQRPEDKIFEQFVQDDTKKKEESDDDSDEVRDDPEVEEQIKKRRLWVVAMSEEIQELLKDYNNYQLHEHLFDGEDDVWLTKLDLLFDDMTLDFELFGKELPSHYLLMSFVGGFIAVPLYLVMNFMSISPDAINFVKSPPPISFMGILESFNFPSTFDFYASMFGSRWENLLLMLAISLLYLLKPLTTTCYLLSLQPGSRALNYIATELFSKAFYIVISMVAFDKQFTMNRLMACGLLLALLSQMMYYWASQEGGRRDKVEIKSAVQAIREMIKYENVKEVQEIEEMFQRFDTVQGSLDAQDLYKILLDLVLSSDIKSQLKESLNLSTLNLSQNFDRNFHNHTCFWGQSYPRPSSEYLNFSYIIKENRQYQKIPKNELIQVKNKVYDLKTIIQRKELKNQEKKEFIQNNQEDLQSLPLNSNKRTFPKSSLRRNTLQKLTSTINHLDDDDADNIYDDTRLHTTSNLLQQQQSPPSSIPDDLNHHVQQINNKDDDDNESSVCLEDDLLSDNYSSMEGDDADADGQVGLEVADYDRSDQRREVGVNKNEFYQQERKEEEEEDGKQGEEEVKDDKRSKSVTKKKKGKKGGKKEDKNQDEGESKPENQIKSSNLRSSLIVEDIK